MKQNLVWQKYLKEFKRLETKLRLISRTGDGERFYSILDKVERDNYLIKAKRNLILDFYALRNVFAHAERDKYIAEIKEFAFQELQKIIKLLENPPTVGVVFKTEVYTTTPKEITEVVLRKMSENLYTHVPIYQNGKFYGTLSESTLLSWLVDNIKEGKAQFYKRLIGDIRKEYLFNENDKVDFISETKSIFEVQAMFEEAIRRVQRLGALIITKSGKKDEKPIGIITAWDLPRIDQFIERNI